MLCGRWSVALWLMLLATVTPARLFAGSTERVSVANSGEQANGGSGAMPGSIATAISTDGHYVAFSSEATNLVLNDTNQSVDIFLRDRLTGATERISLNSAGEQGELRGPGGIGGGAGIPGDFGPAVSSDGRFVAFSSDATNLVAGDTNQARDIFVRDRVAGTTERVSVSSAGGEGNADSASTPFLTLQFDAPTISADGRFVAFSSNASNLVPGDSNGRIDVFVRDRLMETTERVSISSASGQGNADFYYPAVSTDGRFVVFCGSASANITPGDTNGTSDVFVHDRLTGTTETVSVNSASEQGNGPSGEDRPTISADGTFVTFSSRATNLTSGDTNQAGDVFVRDRAAGTTERVSISSTGETGTGSSVRGNSGGGITGCFSPAISTDGTFVTFESCFTNLVPGDGNGFSDVFARDRLKGTTELISLSSWGQQGNRGSDSPAVSANGRFVAFGSWSPNLVSGDTNGVWDAFVRDREGFPDVPFSHWAFSQISACVDAGLVTGYPDGTYQPNLAVARDQMAVYISRALAGGDEHVPTGPAEATFADVGTGHWAYKYVEYAVANEVVRGYDATHYRPEEMVTRDQMAAFVARARGWVGIDDDMTTAPQLFPDVAAGFWAGTAIQACVENGVVKGYDDGTYRPDEQVTRDQMAVYIARAFKLPT